MKTGGGGGKRGSVIIFLRVCVGLISICDSLYKSQLTETFMSYQYCRIHECNYIVNIFFEKLNTFFFL